MSGGLDSALVAALAVEALGPEAVTGLLMPGPYSSPGSLSDAWETAKLLGIKAVELPIKGMNEQVLDTLDPIFADLPANVAEKIFNRACATPW